MITRQFYHGTWYRTESPLLLRSTLKILNLDQCFQNELIRKNFQNIKRLKIYSSPSLNDHFQIEKLNFFENLNHLEINNLELKSDAKLNLDKLELFFINFVTSNDTLKNRLSINAPELRTFHTYNKLDLFQFDHPQSLKSIISLGWNEANWTSFINLNELISFDLSSFKADFLISLSKLKRIQFFKEDDTFRQLKKMKKELKRTNLRIQYLGVECDEFETSMSLISNISNSKRDSLNDQNLPFYLNNHQKSSSSIYFIKEFNYGQIRNALDHKKEFRDIFELTLKLVDVQKITLEGQFRGSKLSLNKFLRDFKNLNTLIFDQFTPNIIDRLPNRLPNLQHLDICKQTNNNRRHLCNILASFKNLISVAINVHINLKHIELIFMNNKYLNKFNMIIDPTYHVIIQRFWPQKNIRVITCRFSDNPIEIRALKPEEVENLRIEDASTFVSCVNYSNLKMFLKSFSFRRV